MSLFNNIGLGAQALAQKWFDKYKEHIHQPYYMDLKDDRLFMYYQWEQMFSDEINFPKCMLLHLDSDDALSFVNIDFKKDNNFYITYAKTLGIYDCQNFDDLILNKRVYNCRKLIIDCVAINFKRDMWSQMITKDPQSLLDYIYTKVNKQKKNK